MATPRKTPLRAVVLFAVVDRLRQLDVESGLDDCVFLHSIGIQP